MYVCTVRYGYTEGEEARIAEIDRQLAALRDPRLDLPAPFLVPGSAGEKEGSNAAVEQVNRGDETEEKCKAGAAGVSVDGGSKNHLLKMVSYAAYRCREFLTAFFLLVALPRLRVC